MEQNVVGEELRQKTKQLVLAELKGKSMKLTVKSKKNVRLFASSPF